MAVRLSATFPWLQMLHLILSVPRDVPAIARSFLVLMVRLLRESVLIRSLFETLTPLLAQTVMLLTESVLIPLLFPTTRLSFVVTLQFLSFPVTIALEELTAAPFPDRTFLALFAVPMAFEFATERLFPVLTLLEAASAAPIVFGLETERLFADPTVLVLVAIPSLLASPESATPNLVPRPALLRVPTVVLAQLGLAPMAPPFLHVTPSPFVVPTVLLLQLPSPTLPVLL